MKLVGLADTPQAAPLVTMPEPAHPLTHAAAWIGTIGAGYYVHHHMKKGWGWTILAGLVGGGIAANIVRGTIERN